MNQYKVTISWGSESSKLDAKDSEITYSFESESEKNAFLDGVDAACGWMDYDIVEEEIVRSFLPTGEDPSYPKYSC